MITIVASCCRMLSTEEADGCIVAFLPPACLSDQPGCTPIFAKNFSDKISHFLKTGKLGNLHTCLSGHPARFYWFSVVLTKCSLTCAQIWWSLPPVPAFVLSSGNVNRSFYWGELFIHPMKGSPPTSHSHHSMWYFRISSSLHKYFIVMARFLPIHGSTN